MLVKVDGKDTATVVDALATQVQTLPVQLRASLTWDRGMELADHNRFTVATDVAVYFCDPKPLAARHEREHQRPAPSVLPEEDRPLGLQPSRPGRGRCSAEQQAAQDPRLPDACRYAGRGCCIDRLNLQRPSSVISRSVRRVRFSRRSRASSARSSLVRPSVVPASTRAWMTQRRSDSLAMPRSRATSRIEWPGCRARRTASARELSWVRWSPS